VIQSYGDEATRDIHYGDESKAARRIPKDVWPIARRKLNIIENATSLDDCRVPPGNRLEKLKGDWKGFYSIRVNDQWRIVFRFFDNATAHDVQIVDYH
jgi:proteic killer suppression protein